MKLSKKLLNNIFETNDFEEIYKFFLQNFPIYKNFETHKMRQIFFDLGKFGQIVFEKQNGKVECYTHTETKFNLEKYPNLEYKFNISLLWI